MTKSPLTPVELAEMERVRRETETGTYYGLLGLDLQASTEDVESSYRAFVRDWHPDRFFSRDAGEHVVLIESNFVEVTRAYKALRDARKRTVYDADLTARGVSVTSVSGVARDERVGFEVRVDRKKGAATVSALSDVERAAAAPPAHPKPTPPRAPPAPRPATAVDRMRAQMTDQLARAKDYYTAGLADFNEGRFSKAESALYLAMRYDPRNTTYSDLFKQAQARSRTSRSASFVALGHQSEQFGNAKEAMVQYRRAVECEPDDGVAYYRLALLVRTHEEDDREAASLLRKAIQKEPRRAEFRVALAELYIQLKLEQNALREAQAAAEADPKNEKARALYKQLRASAR